MEIVKDIDLKMNARQFLIDYFEIESERYEREGDACIAEMLYDYIGDGDITELISVMKKYAEEYSKRMEE